MMNRVGIAFLVISACSSSTTATDSGPAVTYPAPGTGGAARATTTATGTGGKTTVMEYGGAVGTGGRGTGGAPSMGGEHGQDALPGAGGSPNTPGPEATAEPQRDGGAAPADAQGPEASPLCASNDGGFSSCGDGAVTNLATCCFCESRTVGTGSPYALTMQPPMCDDTTIRVPGGAKQSPPCTTWDQFDRCRSCSSPNGDGSCTP
jgi:hypothetical protein